MVDHRQNWGRRVGINIIGITVLVQKNSMPVALFSAKVIIRGKLLLCLERSKISHGCRRSHSVCDRSVKSCRSDRPYYLGRYCRTAADRAGSSITDRIKRNQRERNVFNGFVWIIPEADRGADAVKSVDRKIDVGELDRRLCRKGTACENRHQRQCKNNA